MHVDFLFYNNTMVRVKNRYLLVNILYPDSTGSRSSEKVPDLVEFNHPTTDDLTPQVLLKGIRSHIAELFGDYGSGAVSESLTGISRWAIADCC